MAGRTTRFKPDRNLERTIEMTAGGIISGTARPTGGAKRRTTLERISEEMADEARRYARAYPQKPRRSAGGLEKTAPRHPFDRSNPNTETYIRSIRALEPAHVGGRLSIRIVALHPNAKDVEYGNEGGVVRRVHGKFKIPIHKWKYDRMQQVRNMSLKKRRAAGWPSAQKDMRRFYGRKSSLRRSVGLLQNTVKANNFIGKDERERRIRTKAVALAAESSRAKGRLSTKRRVYAIGPNSTIPADRHYMIVTSFETYSEYGILRRAMNIIAIRRFE